MKLLTTHKELLGSLIAILMITACGGPPQNNPLLEQAESEFAKAERDSLIVQKAPVPLKEAEENLQMSQEIWKEKGDKELIEHYAYIAKQKTAIARETAKLNKAQEQVESAESERKEVLLAARKAEAEANRREARQRKQEADAAERRAQEALAQARQERQEAERARQEAEEAREEAKSARQRAEEMADRLNELEAKQTERGLVLTLSDVLFDFGKAELNAGSKRVITELKNFLEEYPDRTILIEGYTDSIGSEEYNMKLAQERAEALKTALINSGVPPRNIETEAYGEQYPVASNQTDAGRQQNRRVEVVISDEEGEITERSSD